ncbi:MAG: hypothetical protein PUB07_02900 [Clostridia bacterium]|nr:hypothetical protein [Clostridia bacterium]
MLSITALTVSANGTETTEKVANGGFETFVDSQLDAWTLKNATTNQEFYASKDAAHTGDYGVVITNSRAEGSTVVKAVSSSMTAGHTKDDSTLNLKYNFKFLVSAWINIPQAIVGKGLSIAVYRDGGSATTTYPPVVLGGGSAGNQGDGSCVTDGYTAATNGWKHVYRVFTQGGTTSFANMCVSIELGGTGSVYVDDISITPVTGELLNGDFEDTLSDTAFCGGWTWPTSSTYPVANIETEGAYSGDKCFSISSSAAKKYPYLLGTISNLKAAAQVYKVSFMYKTDGDSRPMVHADDGSQVNAVETNYTDGTDWRACYAYLNKPEGQTFLRIRFVGDNTSVRYYDDVKVEEDITSLTFIDSQNRVTTEIKEGENTAWLRYVTDTEPVSKPILVVCSYSRTNGVKTLVNVTILSEPIASEQTVDEATRYINTYKLPIQRDETVSQIKAFAWDQLSGLVPVTEATAVQ